MQTCFDKSAEFAQRARLASNRDKQFILYGMAWMWMTLSKHAEVREGFFPADLGLAPTAGFNRSAEPKSDEN